MVAVGKRGRSTYIAESQGCGARQGTFDPWAYNFRMGAVPGRARGLGHMAPTYLRREPGIERSDGRRGSALSPRLRDNV